MVTYLPSHKPSVKDKQDMLGTAEEEWTLTLTHARVGQLTRTYIHQFCADTRYNLEDLPVAMDDSDGCWEREPRDSVLSAWLDDDDDIHTNKNKNDKKIME